MGKQEREREKERERERKKEEKERERERERDTGWKGTDRQRGKTIMSKLIKYKDTLQNEYEY